MKPHEVARTILEEKISYGLSACRLGLYCVTVLVWVLLIAMYRASLASEIFTGWPLTSMAGLALYLSILSVALGFSQRLQDILRKRIEVHLRMKFHWYF